MRTSLTAVWLSSLLILASCSGNSPTQPGPTSGDIDDIIRAAGTVVPPAEEQDVITETHDVEDGDYRYTYETHDVVDNIESITYLGLNDDVIWPGSMVLGDHIESFVYEPVTLPRAPVTLSVSLESSTTGESITNTVDDPKLSTVRQGISDLLSTAITGETYVPAKVEFSHEQMFSQSQVNLYVGADVSYGLGSLDTAFDWSNTEIKSRVVAKYRQLYYSIDMDYPQHPSDLLSGNVTPDEVRDALPPGSCPLYVAGVSYGMMAVMTMESSFSYEEMNLAIDAAYKGLVDVQVTSQYTAGEILSNSNLKIIVYGGSTAGLSSLEEGLDGFMKVINASHEFNSRSPGVPLVYKFRHCADNTLAAVTLTSQYTLVRPFKLRQRYRLSVDQFLCTMADDEGPSNNPDMDRFSVAASTFQRASKDDPEVPGISDESVYYWETSGWETMGRGYVWICKGTHTLDLVFDSEHYDFDLARLHLYAWARDYDTTSANDYGDGTIDILGNQFLEHGGQHVFRIDGSDFRFEVTVSLYPLD